MRIRIAAVLAVAFAIAGSFSSLADEAAPRRTLSLTATAYNSVPEQTNSEPNIAAWGDSLTPGMKVIAVSRDLLEIGLTRGAEVEIDGIPGTFRVLDKMGRRWEQRIDIYMGDDIQAAREWGVRNVQIYY
jgi:3D (Asp-Asp-Asp) domain-containing protein